MTIVERKLSKTSVFSAEVLKSAPADLSVTAQSKKYTDLRKELLEALESQSWGVRIKIATEDPAELPKRIRSIYNAGHCWERAIKLGETRGLKISTRITSLDTKTSQIDIFFVKNNTK